LKMEDREIVDYGRNVIAAEVKATKALVERLDERFAAACRTLLSCGGRVVLTGMGKAGLIARKISATFASTGTPSLYMHPAEALHGDLGRVRAEDVVLALSNSGATGEVVKLLVPMKRLGVRVIAITGEPASPLGEAADVLLEIGDVEEACPLGLAPSASTAAMLAMGDALALTVFQVRLDSGELSAEDFAAYHPAGVIGRKLLKVSEVMRTGEAAPVVGLDATVEETVLAITRGRAGAAVVVDENGRLTGIFTDGDLRRYILREDRRDMRTDRMREVMVRNPKTAKENMLAAEAHAVMKKHRIGEMPVVDEEGRPLGVVNLKDITGMFG